MLRLSVSPLALFLISPRDIFRQCIFHQPARMSAADPTFNVESTVGNNATWFGFAALALATLNIFGA